MSLLRARGRRRLAAASWRLHPARPHRAYQLLSESQWWPVGELRELQLEVLRDTLRAAARMPVYRRRLESAGLGGGALRSLEELSAVRPLEPGELRRGFDGGSRARAIRWGRRVATSGTTAGPAEVTWSLEMMRWAEAAELRAREWLGVDATEPRAWICCNGASRFRKASLRPFNTRLIDARSIADPRSARRVAALLERAGPTLVQGVSNALYELARTVAAEGLRVRPRACWSAANHLLPHYRRTIEAAFRAPVRERYAAAETGLIASQCAEGTLHLQAEHLVVEVVGEDGLPVAPGEVGSVLVTTLRNPRMPLLRYRLGDLAIAGPEGVCPCGRTLPAIAAVVGRSADLLRRADGGTILPQDVFALVARAAPEAIDFQVRQGEGLDLEVDLVHDRPPQAGTDVRGLESAFDRLVGASEITRVAYVDRIPLAPSGKLRHVISNRVASWPEDRA